MFIETALAVEIAPLLYKEKGLLDNSFGVSFGSRILFLFERVG